MDTKIHQMSVVDAGAQLAPGVEVGPFCQIGDNVEIGEGTRLIGNVTVLPGSRIGRNCLLFPGAVVGGIPQDLKFRGEETLAVVGDNTTLRECVTVNRGTAARGITSVGSRCLIMAYSHVAHDCSVGNGVIIANASQLAGEVEIGNEAVIGGGTMIHQFSRIGNNVMVQGGALINKDIPPFVLAARHPITYTGVNIIGMRRRGYTAEQIETVQNIYRIVFQSGLPVSEALVEVNASVPQSEIRDNIVAFIAASERGILKGYDTIKK